MVPLLKSQKQGAAIAFVLIIWLIWAQIFIADVLHKNYNFGKSTSYRLSWSNMTQTWLDCWFDISWPVGFAQSVEVVLARCHNCSSKLCLLFSPFEPRSLKQIRPHKNHNCATATSYHGSKWSSIELVIVHCRKVSPRGCTSFSRAIQVCVGEALLFLIVDLTFHGQWHNVPVRYQPDCSGSLACLGSHPSLANSHGCDCWSCKCQASKCPNCSSTLCMFFGPFELRSLQQRQIRKNHNFGTFSRVSSDHLAFPLRHLRPSLCKLCISLNPVEFVPVWAQVFTANTAAQAWQLWDSLQLPWIEMVCKKVKLRSCTSFPQVIQV